MLDITPICAFDDNYIWLLQPKDSQQAWIVDPGDPAPVLEILDARQLELAGILITHHHFDHTGGITALCEAYPNALVYGPDNPAINGITHTLSDGDSVGIADTVFKVIAVPGHTLDHIAYASDSLLFCGDTLFAGGCGRMFEGTASVMQASLARLAELPTTTMVYCAHEYTLANFAFAAAVEPDNPVLQARLVKAKEQRELQRPTLPSLLSQELASNPFLRWHEPQVQAAAHRYRPHNGTPADVFASLRQWKDNF